MKNKEEIKLAYILTTGGPITSVWDNEADAIDAWMKSYTPSSNIVVRIMNQPISIAEEQKYRNSLHAKMKEMRP